MTINRALWYRLFDQKSFPGLPCPKCATGKLKLRQGTFSNTEPAYSQALHSHSDFEPEWIDSRWVAQLSCDETVCGEIVTLAGDTETVEFEIDEDGFHGWAQEEALRPRSVFPAPPLFRIPTDVPSKVAEQLRLAFQLYWTDLPSCVARLRTSIEVMLDQQGVPKTKMSTSSKPSRMTLHDRIKAFELQSTGVDAADALQALRNVGNLGTHGSHITQETVFDAVDVLEDALLGVYEKKSIKAKAKKLKDL